MCMIVCILDVPIVNVAQLSYQVNIGNDIELVCTITSNPAHTTVYWHKIVSGTPQPITVTGSSKYSGSTLGTPSLTIRNAVQADAGSYRCLADNSVGTGQSQITILNVLGSKYLFILYRKTPCFGIFLLIPFKALLKVSSYSALPTAVCYTFLINIRFWMEFKELFKYD